MKQVKKLLVILPLVALFVLGSLPVFAATPATKDKAFTVEVTLPDATGATTPLTYTVKRGEVVPGDTLEAADIAQAYPVIKTYFEKFFSKGTHKEFNGWAPNSADLTALILEFHAFLSDDSKNTAKVKLEEVPEVNNRKKVIGYDIHANRIRFDQLCEVEMNSDYESPVGIINAFFQKSDLPSRYTMVGYVIKGKPPVITQPIAGLEKIDVKTLEDTMNSPSIKAEYAALLVPNHIRVEVQHIFPEGTRAPLSEEVMVPYATWAHLQTAWTLVDVAPLFRTRIQKINEQGFAFNHIEYYNGLKPVTGLLSSWDWANYPLYGERNDDWVARVFYDVAVAAAKEVPTEKKVDAATAPQAQIQAPAAQAQAPVTAANTTTTTAPANTLPVTGASDSIFLFLSSAALMAVGILFFKKH